MNLEGYCPTSKKLFRCLYPFTKGAKGAKGSGQMRRSQPEARARSPSAMPFPGDMSQIGRLRLNLAHTDCPTRNDAANIFTGIIKTSDLPRVATHRGDNIMELSEQKSELKMDLADIINDRATAKAEEARQFLRLQLRQRRGLVNPKSGASVLT